MTKLNSLWLLAAKLETSCLTRSLDHLNFLSSEIPRNEPHLDSIMFIRHNAGAWQEPPDFVFEPSPVWHDDNELVTGETAKVFLRNVMGKSKIQLSELKREVTQKQKEVEGVKRIRQGIRRGEDKRDEVEVVAAILSLQEEVHRIDHRRLTAEVESATIKSAVGDVTIGAKNHNFKAQTFKIPTNCDLCGDRIWGLSAKGFDCRDCGYTCHSKCEMKVPAECPGEQSKEEKKKLKAERQEAARVSHPASNGTQPAGAAELPALERNDTMSSLSSGYAASARRSVSGSGNRTPTEETEPTEPAAASAAPAPKPVALRKNRVVAPPPAQYISEAPADDRAGNDGVRSRVSEDKSKMLFAYRATGDDEVTVEEGKAVVVLEPDGMMPP